MADNGDIAGGLFAVVYDDSYDGSAWLGAFFISGGENVIEIVAIACLVVGIGVVSGAGVASSVKNGCLRLFYINARRLIFFR